MRAQPAIISRTSEAELSSRETRTAGRSRPVVSAAAASSATIDVSVPAAAFFQLIYGANPNESVWSSFPIFISEFDFLLSLSRYLDHDHRDLDARPDGAYTRVRRGACG